MVVAAPAFLALLVAPFVLARAFRFATSWRDLRAPSLALDVATVVGLFAGSAVGESLGQYLAFLPWFTWIGLLAVRMLRVRKDEAQISQPAREGPVP